MPSDKHPGTYDYRPGLAGTSTSTVVPQVQTQQTLVNLGVGATINFDFTVDTGALLDAFVFSDQVIDLAIFIRQSTSDTYRQLDNAIQATGVANVLKQLLTARRIAGSQVRIQLQNNSGIATTVLSAQVHVRSI